MMSKESNPSFGLKEEKKTMALPSFQLAQVSQRAEKLNLMIDSWSKGIDFDGQNGEIARDLLTGALDLQESLCMLRKHREASKLVAHKKRKQKQSIEKEEAGIGETSLNWLHSEEFKKQLEKPRNSVDGSSRNCIGPQNSVDGSSMKSFRPFNSDDGSSRNCIRPRNSVDGSSRNGFVPRNSFDGSSRKCIEPRHSVDGSSRRCIELRNSLDGSSTNCIKPRNSVDASSRSCIEPRNSLDGSSTNYVEELKKVIRDSLHRQNLLSIPFNEQMVHSHRRQFDSFTDGPPVSSSRSLTVPLNGGLRSSYSYQKERSDDSVSSSSQQKEMKAPSLIAKLMGLDDLPSETAHHNGKQPDTKKTLHPRRTTFDIDMPKARKAEFTEQRVDLESKTLKEIIEAMQFKGLLKSNYAEDLKLQPHLTATPNRLRKQNRKYFDLESSDDALPPIVIIKPLRFSSLPEEIAEPKQTLNKLGRKESKIMGSTDESSKKTEPVSLNYKKLEKEEIKIAENSQKEEPLLDRRKLAKEAYKTNNEEKQKNMRTMDAPSSTIKASVLPNTKKKNVVKVPKKAEEVQKTLPEMIKAPKKAQETQKALPEMIKAPKKAVEMQKTIAERRKPVKENMKSMLQSRAPSKKIDSKPSRPENEVTPVKNLNCGQKTTSQNHNATSLTKPITQNSNQTTKSRTKTAKPLKGSAPVTSIAVNKTCKEDGNVTDLTSEIHSDSTTIKTVPADQLPTQTGEKNSEIPNKDETVSECEIVPEPIQNLGSFEPAKEAKRSADHKETISKADRLYLRQLLLQNPVFLNNAEELFDLHINPYMVSQTNGVEVGMKSSQLFSDYVNELMRHKHRRVGHWSHPMAWARTSVSEVDVTMDKLVDELIENLGCYGKVGDGDIGKDGLYSMLRTDLRCKRLVGHEVWDLGWLNGFSVEDADQVVGEVEKHILDVLIKEIVIDLE